MRGRILIGALVVMTALGCGSENTPPPGAKVTEQIDAKATPKLPRPSAAVGGGGAAAAEPQ